jgi:hypothetical protein
LSVSYFPRRSATAANVSPRIYEPRPPVVVLPLVRPLRDRIKRPSQDRESNWSVIVGSSFLYQASVTPTQLGRVSGGHISLPLLEVCAIQDHSSACCQLYKLERGTAELVSYSLLAYVVKWRRLMAPIRHVAQLRRRSTGDVAEATRHQYFLSTCSTSLHKTI